MPRKKVRREKTREYLESLLDRVGVTDIAIAHAIKAGLESDVANERSKSLDLIAKWKGFYDVDKKVGGDLEKLPIGNISLEDFESISNRCANCKHGRFDPVRRKIIHPGEESAVVDTGKEDTDE